MYSLRVKFTVTILVQKWTGRLQGRGANVLRSFTISKLFVYAFKKTFCLMNCDFMVRENQDLGIGPLTFSGKSLKIIEINSLQNTSSRHHSVWFVSYTLCFSLLIQAEQHWRSGDRLKVLPFSQIPGWCYPGVYKKFWCFPLPPFAYIIICRRHNMLVNLSLTLRSVFSFALSVSGM